MAIFYWTEMTILKAHSYQLHLPHVPAAENYNKIVFVETQLSAAATLVKSILCESHFRHLPTYLFVLLTEHVLRLKKIHRWPTSKTEFSLKWTTKLSKCQCYKKLSYLSCVNYCKILRQDLRNSTHSIDIENLPSCNSLPRYLISYLKFLLLSVEL